MSLRQSLYRLTANRPMRLIEINGRPYLERYYMGRWLRREWWLHHFVSSDCERHVHNHPWSAISFVLTGGYVEERASLGLRRTDLHKGYVSYLKRHLQDIVAPSVNFISSECMHRIAETRAGTWTLMCVGKRHGNGWFFFGETPNGIVKTPPMESSADDWHKTAPCRAAVYAAREQMHRNMQGVMREADACAYEEAS